MRIKIVEKVENKDDKVGKKEGRIEKKKERAVIEQILFLLTRENFVGYEVENVPILAADCAAILTNYFVYFKFITHSR